MSGQRGRAKASNIDLIEKLEDEGRIKVIRPINPVVVDRMEKDTAKLQALYQEGYDVASVSQLFR